MNLLVNLDVDDLKRAMAFYESALGLKVGRRFANDAMAELLGAPVPIYLLVKPAGAAPFHPARSYVRHWTPVHLDFVVEDLDAALARALKAGATLEAQPAARAWGRMANLADPFGHGWCLLEFTERGYDALL